ncbi:MAG: hypothetical protein ACR2OF_00450 [Hyphomicrobium sp.]
MWEQIETVGWRLISYGLVLITLTALSSFVRSPDTPAEAFFWLYGLAWAMVICGFSLLKWIGAWPPPHTNRP